MSGDLSVIPAAPLNVDPGMRSMPYDKLGRQTQDRVTTLGTGVDGAVRRIASTFEVRGMREKITSWNGETVGSGSVVNEVQFTHTNFVCGNGDMRRSS